MNEDELIDFNKATEIPPEYNGSEKKKTMILDGKKYLVKFPDSNRSPKLNISYINNVYPEYILISGGATHSAVWMQILADVMETRIRIPRESECAALGAAILASIGCSAFKSLEDAADALVHTDREYVPNKDNYKIYRGIYQKNIKVYDIINKNGINRLLTGGIHH